jgi:hypothetical protein
LEKKLADADVSEEDQNNLLKYLAKKETEYMRLQRHKMGVEDFEMLTMIGKGAFGEVFMCIYTTIHMMQSTALFCSVYNTLYAPSTKCYTSTGILKFVAG